MSIKYCIVTLDPIEKALLKGLARNDRAATTTLYRDHYGMIQTLVLNNNGTVDDARDVFQEAMVVLYEKVKAGGFELSCQLKTYIYSICRRLWLKRLSQKQRFLPELKVTDSWISVEEDIESFEKQDKAFHLMEKAMNEKPGMWGSSMIGFGNLRYKSPTTGREVDWFKIGFSPRKANLSLHLGLNVQRHAEALAKLGKHKTGVGCLYINKLEDVVIKVLEKMISAAAK